MDGFTATKQIRQIEKELGRAGHKIPIIALTSSTLQTELDKAIQCGMNFYLNK